MSQKNMFAGKQFLREGEYSDAAKAFQQAYEIGGDPSALIFMAVAQYKLGDFNGSEKSIEEAEKRYPDGMYTLRLLGYKSLVLLKKNKTRAPEALETYTDRYSRLYPDATIEDLRRMAKGREIDEQRTEKLIDAQVSRYEEDMDQFLTTGTGYFEAIYGTTFGL
jgi:tetratricopeptide (TPR) repeat protein